MKLSRILFAYAMLLVLTLSSAARAAMCGMDPEGDVFVTKKRDEVVLSFTLVPIKGMLEPPKSKEFLDTNFRAPRVYEAALALLEQRLKEGKLAWVLTDWNQLAVSGGVDSRTLQKQLKKLKVAKRDIEMVMLLTYGPVGVFQLKHPDLKLRVVALPEDQRIEHFISQLESKAVELLTESAGSGLKSSETERLIEISHSDLFAGTKTPSVEYKTLVAKIKKAPMAKIVGDFRRWIDSGIDLINAREKLLTETILVQPGPGVVVATKGYGPGVSERLTSICPTFGQTAGK